MDYSLYIQRPIMAHKNEDGTYTALIFGGIEYYQQVIPQSNFERAYESYSSAYKLGVQEDSEEVPEWTRPSRNNPYKKGFQVSYLGKVYENLLDNNILSPTDFPQGWKEVTATNEKTSVPVR